MILAFYLFINKLFMSISFRQMPHCEGGRLYHQLYNLDASIVGDPSLALTRRSEDGSIILFAGSIHGIVQGDKLSAYANNITDPARNPFLGDLVVNSVDDFTSILALESMAVGSADALPLLLYCKIVDRSTRQSTVLSCSDRSWLESIFPPRIQSQLSLNIVDDDENYDLCLDIDNEQVRFRQGTKLIPTSADCCMSNTVSTDDIDKIRKVVKRYIHFYSNLEHFSTYAVENIDIELNELMRNDGKFVPSTLRMLDEDQISIPASDTKMYGLTLRNNSMVKVYPYLFFFDPMDLTIRESLFQTLLYTNLMNLNLA